MTEQQRIPADAIVFDLGNTLIADPRAAVIGGIAEQCVKKLSRWKKGLHPGTFARTWLQVDAQLHGRYWSHFMQEEPIVQRALLTLAVPRETRALQGPEMLALYRRALRQHLSRGYDAQPVRNALVRLQRAGKLLMVFSDDREIGTENMLRWADLLEFFRPHVFCSEQLGLEKGEPGLFELLFEKIKAERPQITPDRVVHVGDVPSKDIDPPKAAGWRTVLYRAPCHAQQAAVWRDYQENPRFPPDAIIARWSQLATLIA